MKKRKQKPLPTVVPTQPKRGRTCGSCTACCTWFNIPEVDKTYGETCRHCNPAGCGIYGSRPSDCRIYTCAWIDGLLDKKHRPDRLGVAFDSSEIALADQVAATGKLIFLVREVKEGMADKRAALDAIHAMAKHFGVILVRDPVGPVKAWGPTKAIATEIFESAVQEQKRREELRAAQ
jgi:hypothetical protein